MDPAHGRGVAGSSAGRPGDSVSGGGASGRSGKVRAAEPIHVVLPSSRRGLLISSRRAQHDFAKRIGEARCEALSGPKGPTRKEPAVDHAKKEKRSMTAVTTSSLFATWAQRDLNPRLQPCEGRTLPLSYAPERRDQ